MKKITNFLFITVAFLFSTVIMAQSTITGTVLETGINMSLPGASKVAVSSIGGT